MRNASNLAPEAGAFPNLEPRRVSPARPLAARVATPSGGAAVRPLHAGAARNDEHFTDAGVERASAAAVATVAAAEPAEAIRFASAPQPGRASLAAIVATLATALLEWLHSLMARRSDANPGSWRSRREIRIQAAHLRDLDPHILRDIGISDVEAISVVAERHGLAEASRVRVLLDARQAGG